MINKRPFISKIMTMMDKAITYLKKVGFIESDKIDFLKVKYNTENDLRYFWNGYDFGLHISSSSFSEWKNLINELGNCSNKTKILYLNGNFFDTLEITDTYFSELVYLYISDNLEVHQLSIHIKSSKLKELTITKCENLNILSIVGDFSNIEKVDCWNNALTELNFNAQAPKLFYLNFSQNDISRLQLPHSPKLRYLFASKNLLKEISLVNYSNLEIIEIAINAILNFQMPKNMPNLEILNLETNLLKEFCLLGNYPKLHTISCSHNSLNNVYIGGDFHSLIELDLSCNTLSSIQLCNLPSLIDLKLNKNKLTDKAIVRYILSNCPSLESIDLNENNTGILEDIISYCRPKEILQYLEEEGKNRAKQQIFKIIFIGNECVGKTTLWHWLDKKKFVAIDEKERTHGIIIERWQHPNNNNFEFNVWDFAGQEIYHPMHRLFMTEGTIYVMLWASNQPCPDYENKPLGYWIDYIADMSSKSYILSLQNLFEKQQSKDLAELSAEMKNKYKANGINILGLDAINLKTASEYDLEEVADKILTTAKKIRSEIKEDVPQTWYDVAKELESKKRKTPRISKEFFFQICKDKKITKGGENTLLTHLHHTGVVFYNKGCWDDEIILNQQSILEPIYELLKGNLKSHLNWIDLREKWSTFNNQEIEFLIGFMEKCGVLFKKYIEEKYSHDIKTAEFVIPQFLEVKKNVKPDDYQKIYDWRLQIAYPFWHQSIFDKFIIKILKYAISQGDIFRNFAEFNYYGIEVLFHTDNDLKEVNLYVKGEENDKQKEIIELLRNDLNQLKKLDRATDVYTNLKTKTSINRADWEKESINILYKPVRKRLPKFFISYANDDAHYFDAFIEKITVATKHEWDIWTDKKIQIGDNWQKEIKYAVEDCDFAILAISHNFLASDFIKQEELAEFIKKTADEKKGFKFFPFLLKPIVLSNATELTIFETLSNTQFFRALGQNYNYMRRENKLIAFSELLKRDNGKFYADNDMDTNYINDLIESIKKAIS